MQLIRKYFPTLTKDQYEKLARLHELYESWNAKINVISRKDMDSFYEKHVLHSMAIALYVSFGRKEKVLDVGTGGGFPGIPLAILFPETEFVLVDSIGKKVMVVQEVARDLELQNVEAVKSRVEDLPSMFNFITARAVTAFPQFVKLAGSRLMKKGSGGILYLKGGDFESELKGFGKRVKVHELSANFEEEFFETKKLIYLPSSAIR